MTKNQTYTCFAIGAIIVLSLGAVKSAAGPPLGDYAPEELICRMVVGFDIGAINEAYGTTVRNHQPQTDCYLLGTQPGANAESLAVIIDAREDVEYCRPNFYLDAPEPLQRSSPFLDLECIGTFPDLEASETLDLVAVQDITLGDAVTIAVIDGGINLTHPVFAAKTGGVHSGWDFVDNDSIAFDEPGGPGSGHGTFVAGIIKTVAPACHIYAYRVLDTLGRGNGFDIAAAVLRAVDDGCQVINLSLGMLGRHDALEDALHYAEDHNIVVVAAAGNDSTNQSILFPYPAITAYCLAIAALDTVNQKADFSNYGEKIFASAPGTGIYSAFLGTSYAWWDGTSFSAPFVSGLACLLFSVNPSLTWRAVHDIIGATAIDIDSLNPGCENMLGHGLINTVAAVETASTFVCGDADFSGEISIADAVFMIDYIFRGGPAPLPDSRGDANNDGRLNVGDAVFIIAYIFLSGPAPCSSL